MKPVIHPLARKIGSVLEDIELLATHYVDEGVPPVCRLLSAQIAILTAKDPEDFPTGLVNGAARLANIFLLGLAERHFSEVTRAHYKMDEKTLFYLNEISASGVRLVVQDGDNLRISLQGADLERYPSFHRNVNQYLKANGING